MENKKRSEKFLRRRKMLVVLPLLVLPFITIGFYVLGGGQQHAKNTSGLNTGLNLDLPAAEVNEEKEPTKLTFYNKAEEAERQREKELQNDSYFQLEETGGQAEEVTTYKDPVEEKINRKIKLLEAEMNRPVKKDDDVLNTPRASYSKEFDGDVDRLEQMVGMMKETKTDDPEMKQLDSLLEKILDVQHPERVQIQPGAAQNAEPLFYVRRYQNRVGLSAMGVSPVSNDSVQFYSWPHPSDAGDPLPGAIEATIIETQSLVNGSVIRLRLEHDIVADDKIIPKGTLVVGLASLNGERLNVLVNSIRLHRSLYPVRLQAFDLDGLPGIYVPGAITRDVAKQSADNGLGLMGASAMDRSFSSQVTAAGIGAAKNWLSRKVKVTRVIVKAGYRVLLAAKNQ